MQSVNKPTSLLKLKKISKCITTLLLLLLPTQLGKHFWPPFSYVLGIRIDYLSPTLYSTDILIALLFIVWLISNTYKKKSLKTIITTCQKSLSQHRVFILFVVYLLFNLLIASNVFSSGYGLVKLLEYSFLIFFISSSWNTQDIEWAGYISVLPVIGESVLAIAQYIHQSSIGGIIYLVGERTFTSDTPGIANASVHGQLLLRPYGTLPHPNVLSGYLLCMLILISFSFVKETIRYRKILEASALLLGSIGITLSFSRVVILLWCCIVFILLITNLLRKTKMNLLQKGSNTWKYTLVILSMLAGLLFLFHQPFLQLFYRFSQTSITEESFIQRKDLIQNAITIIAKHPIFGVGLHNFLPALSQIRSPLSPTFYLQPVHNIFLLWVAETGLVGLTFLMIFIIKTIKQLVSLMNQKNPATKTLFLLFITLLILGSFDHYLLTLQQGQLLTSLVLGMIWIKNKKKRNIIK